ncbi:hypothetical protein [Polynucleobacter asymbioticus]|jgi:hypothetical protein|uniref:Uncharacterized protein n=1 Tax=Polynucleobacter asymbioticus TaxID=576611 RepID=A0AAC9IU63_9BURK|nr:hypothetical protein [Polynucleobacter asymbioticus]APB98377.1 hypothetical protein A4F89_02995 [Polynucleobacter asymbioticus]APC00663.1 hypothetical protein AOC25_03000 [Polynucleobacter asymbioticus]
MPLPSVEKFGAKRCIAKNRKTGLQCKNPSAWSCKVCRYHGARKSKNAVSGEDHYRFKNGEQTLRSRINRSEASLRIRMLEAIGWHIDLFVKGSGKTRGRKPRNFPKLDLNNANDLITAILISLPK